MLAQVVNLLGLTSSGPALVRMETADVEGRTDLELEFPNGLVVVEAKRGWRLPERAQLSRYASRVRQHSGAGALVTLSNSSERWARRVLPTHVMGVPVRHLQWVAVRAQLDVCRRAARGTERHWLEQLALYLRKVTPVADPSRMWTYCVTLSNRLYGPSTHRRLLLTEGIYFHPFGWGHGWPKDPPNFMAFRWGSRVQRVHRVADAEVVPDLRHRSRAMPKGKPNEPLLLYTLAPPLRFDPLPTGRTYRASRMWVLLDQLFTCATLAEAKAESDRLAHA